MFLGSAVLRLGCALESCKELVERYRCLVSSPVHSESGHAWSSGLCNFKSTLVMLMPAKVREALAWGREGWSRLLVFCH